MESWEQFGLIFAAADSVLEGVTVSNSFVIFEILSDKYVENDSARVRGSLSNCYSIHCGSSVVSPGTTSRIVGGTAAKAGVWPWSVLLTEINYPLCGGAIIGENAILTAAHCFEDQLSRDASRWMATAGMTRIDKYEYTQRSYRIQKIIVHEDYNSTSMENDLALLILSSSIRYSNYIRPICLPEPNEMPVEGKVCYLAGWGSTKGTGDSRNLNQVALPIIEDKTCSRPDWYGFRFKPNTSFCAGIESGGIDACKGDSGSPLVCEKNNVWKVYGLSSWGYGCGDPRYPGIYTEVSKYNNWIYSNLSKRLLG